MYIALNFYLTNGCNLKCEHCVHDCSPNKIKEQINKKQFEYALGFIDYISTNNFDYKIKVIGITGGEPMLHNKFYNILNDLKEYTCDKYKIPIELYTNGSIKFNIDYINIFSYFFKNIYIGHDIWHRNQILLNKLYLEELSYVSKNIIIRLGSIFRDKGQMKNNLINSKNFNFKERIYNEGNCSMIGKNDLIVVNFAPYHIRFCCENSIYKKESPNCFAEYDILYDELMKKALNFKNNFSREKCPIMCNHYYIDGRK